MKIAVIGGASTYTPELVDGLLRRGPALDLTEIHLQDPDGDRLEVVAALARRMAEQAGASIVVSQGGDLETALRDSRFVVAQLRVGGQAARLADELLCREAGLVAQETAGVGGFICALRTIPAMLDLAGRVQQVAPEATLVNFTNPSGLMTELVLRLSSVRCLGLCNIPWNLRVAVARDLAVDPREVELDYVGLNHLSWVRGVKVGGIDRTADVVSSVNGSPFAQGVWPNPYLAYYADPASVIERQRHTPPRAAEVTEIERRLLERYRDPDLRTKPPELAERGGAHYSEAAAELLVDLKRESGAVHVVNTRNGGAVPNLPDDVVVEVSARVSGEARTIPTAPLAPAALELVGRAKRYELLTIEAAVTGDQSVAREALLTNPLGPDASQVDALWQRIRAQNPGALGSLDA